MSKWKEAKGTIKDSYLRIILFAILVSLIRDLPEHWHLIPVVFLSAWIVILIESNRQR